MCIWQRQFVSTWIQRWSRDLHDITQILQRHWVQLHHLTIELHRALTPYFYNYQHPHSVRSITFLSPGNHTVCEVCHLQWSFAWNHTWLIYCRVDLLWMLLEQERKWIWFAPQRKMSVPALSEWFYKNIPKYTPVYWVLSRVYTAKKKDYTD